MHMAGSRFKILGNYLWDYCNVIFENFSIFNNHKKSIRIHKYTAKTILYFDKSSITQLATGLKIVFQVQTEE